MNYGLGLRSKSQDAIRHRKTVRFVSDTLGNSAEDLTEAGNNGGRRPSRGRNFFLLSMIQGDNNGSSSSNSIGRFRGLKVLLLLLKKFIHYSSLLGSGFL